ncbi:MAG: molecular chaperone DnaJ [Deltaproteobacteria bacterium]|nr:molecular chaperone DnaJ [Deltaproteobacteria bacterium]
MPVGQAITVEELEAAGRLVFGPSFLLHGGWRDQLKRTYKKRVLETHPDRAQALGRSEAELAREFHALAEAYRLLVEAPVTAPRRAPSRSPSRTRSAPRQAAQPRAKKGPARPAAEPPRGRARVHVAFSGHGLPRRRLRFAEYLFYSGRVTWEALVQAVAWQRRQRPPVGRIAVQYGFLTSEQVSEILAARHADGRFRVPFGTYAVERGYLRPLQRLALLGTQARLQRRIGQYFVERGLISEEEIEGLKAALWRHNARHAGAERSR